MSTTTNTINIIDAKYDLNLTTIQDLLLTNKFIKKFGLIDKLDNGLTTVVYNTISHDTVVCITPEKEKLDYLLAISDVCDLGVRHIHTETIELPKEDPITYYVYQIKRLNKITSDEYETEPQFKETKLLTDLYRVLEKKANNKEQELTVKALEYIIPFITDKSLEYQCKKAMEIYGVDTLDAFISLYDEADRTKSYPILDTHISNFMFNNTTKQVVLLDPAFMGVIAEF